MILKLLCIKPFLYLWLSQVLSQIGINVVNFVLLLHISQLTRSNTADSVFIIAISIPAVVLGTLAGVYVDRHEKKQIMLVSNLLRAGIVLAFLFTTDTLFWIYLLAVIASVITQFYVPAEAPLIPELVPPKLILSANGLFTLTFYASVTLGFMIAGPLLSFFGIRYVFIFIAVLFFIAAFFAGIIPKTNTKPISQNFAFDFQEIFVFLKNNRSILEALIIMAASQAMIATMAALSPGYATTVLNLSVTDASLYIVAPAVLGMITGSIGVGLINRETHAKLLINISVFLAGVFLSILSFLSRGRYQFDKLAIAVISLFLLGLLNSVITVYANAMLQEKTPVSIRSRVYGFLTAAGGFGAIIPVFMAGILSDIFGVVKVMFGMGLVVMLVGCGRLIYNRRI